VVRQGLVLFEQFVVAVFPDPAGFLLDGLVLHLLILLHVFLHFLEDKAVLLLDLPHAFSERVVLFLEGQPLLLAVDRQELVHKEGAFLVQALVLFVEGLVTLIEVEEAFLPEGGLSLELLDVLGSYLTVPLLVVLRRILVSFLSGLQLVFALVLLQAHLLLLQLLLVLQP
jgi:hypothetical protein